MPETIPSDSVGIVVPQSQHFAEPLDLVCQQTLNQYDLVYETYGELNPSKSNAILVCHALSGDHHAAGYHSMEDKKPGWWDAMIGPGKPLDSCRFFIVSVNNIGHCNGSTGPSSINPETNSVYGPTFPIVTVKDWVVSQARLADLLGIERWAAVVGGSLGGMQAMQWAIDYPERVRYALVIASASRLSAQNIAFNEVARQAILRDPHFYRGDYIAHDQVPSNGLMLARMLGHITYLSDDAMAEKFGRELRKKEINYSFDVEFEVESYLRHQGLAFVDRFDANTYLLMTKALDYFDPASEYGDDLARCFEQTRAKFLVISFTTDWRFSPERSREIVKALKDVDRPVTYAEIEAAQGHDAFLMPIPQYERLLHAYLENIYQEICE